MNVSACHFPNCVTPRGQKTYQCNRSNCNTYSNFSWANEVGATWMNTCNGQQCLPQVTCTSPCSGSNPPYTQCCGVVSNPPPALCPPVTPDPCVGPNPPFTQCCDQVQNRPPPPICPSTTITDPCTGPNPPPTCSCTWPNTSPSVDCCNEKINNREDLPDECCDHPEFASTPACIKCSNTATACGVGSNYHKERFRYDNDGFRKDWFSRSSLVSCFQGHEYCGGCAACVAACPAGGNHHRIQSTSDWWRPSASSTICQDKGSNGPAGWVRCGGLECLKACSTECAGVFDTLGVIPSSPGSPPTTTSPPSPPPSCPEGSFSVFGMCICTLGGLPPCS